MLLETIFLFLIQFSVSKLTINNPDISDAFDEVEISYELFPLDNFPYGRILYGYLHYEEEDGCSEFKIQSSLNPKEISFFILMEDNRCEFSIKALNTQSADAEMIIVISDLEIDKKLLQENIHPTNSQIHIPILIIKKKDGNKLKNLLKKYTDFILKYESSIPESNRVQVDIYIDIQDQEFQTFLKKLNGLYEQSDEMISFNFNFFKQGNEQQIEQLAELQIYLNCLNPDLVFQNINFIQTCFQKNDKNESLEKCFSQQFIKDYQTEYTEAYNCYQKNLFQIQNIKENMMNMKKPKSSIYINDKLFVSKQTRKNLMNEICQRFETSPKNCIYSNQQYEIRKSDKKPKMNKGLFIFINIIVLLILLTLTALVLYIIYQKIYQHMLANRVEEIVRDTVSFHYSRIE